MRSAAKREKELQDKSRQFREWKRWRRDRRETLLVGPYGPAVRALLDFLDDMTSPSALVAFVKDGPWRDTDLETRAEILVLISTAIITRREKAGMTPFDDPLPGQPSGAFLQIREYLLDEIPALGAAPPGAQPGLIKLKTIKHTRFAMNNALTPTNSPPGDGFYRSSTSGRSIAAYLKWTDTLGWRDRDGMAPPAPLLVFRIDDFLRRWENNMPTDILDKPLPNLEELNAAIPKDTWEKEDDGKPKPPWQHYVAVYLIDPATGKGYRYEHCTGGAHIAWDELRESVVNTRLLRGDRCLPLVNPTDKPWKVTSGLRKRPYFHIIGWKTPGDDREVLPAKSPTPQLPGPAPASTGTPPPAPASSPPTNNSAQSHQPKPKPPVNLANETLAAMGDVKPLTTSEILNDEVPW